MYSEQLEQLIQSVIADGVVTEKERAVLHKRAAAEGVNEDEIDVYVDGLLAKVEPKEKEPKKYDLSVFNKARDSYGDTYYLFQKFYKITFSRSTPVKEMLIAFADVVQSDFDYYLGMKLIVLVKYNPNYRVFSDRRDCNLKTNIGSLQFPVTSRYLMDIIPRKHDNQIQFVYNLDAEQLKMLADSESINLSLETLVYKPDDKNGWMDIDAAATFAEIKNVNCPGLQSYAQCFYREVVDNTAYLDAEITNMPPNNCSIRIYGVNVEAEIAAGLLSIKPKKLKKTDVNTPLMKQYIGVNDIVVTHISGKKKLNKDDKYPEFLRLHALTNPQNGVGFYLAYICKGWHAKLAEIRVRVNMQDYILRAIITKEERVLERDYIGDDKGSFNFYAVESALLKQILTTKTGVSFYKGDKDNKGLKVNKMPKAWLEAYTLLTDSKAFEQWKQEQIKFKKEHPILNFFRSLFS